MQFKHPELLWALLLLLIPIIIHLFQLRHFKKTPFTNVKFLKKVVSKSRRSRSVKKWLLLCARILLLAAIVLAFAQPFFANSSSLLQRETVIYLDNSFSMQAKSDATTLLETGIQSLIKSIPKNQKFTLFTNDRIFRQISLPEAQNDILTIEPVSKQLQLNEVILKGNTFFQGTTNTIKNLIVVSDFQKRMVGAVTDVTDTIDGIRKHLVQIQYKSIVNITLDSIYENSQSSENKYLTAIISKKGSIENTPVSLYNGTRLIAKTSAVFDDNDSATAQFTVPKNERIDGKLMVSDAGLSYDNELHFNIDANKKIKVLAIGDADANFDYLKKIYTDDVFQFKSTVQRKLNFGDISAQNLIVLNELPSISTAISTSLKSFTDDGGSFVVVPSSEIDLNSYNALTNNYFSTSFKQKVDLKKAIVNIAFSHPIYSNVFERKSTNFQFPEVSHYYNINTKAAIALSFDNDSPFLIGDDGMYIFTSSLSSSNSNFKSSPLIVPTFFRIGENSLKLPSLYVVLGSLTSVEIPVKLPDDTVLKVAKEEYEFIPQQQALPNKVTLAFDDTVRDAGLYTINQNGKTVKRISFNHNRDESTLEYADINTLKGANKAISVATLFDTLEKDSTVTEHWKWFIILALLLLLVEGLIQKFMI